MCIDDLLQSLDVRGSMLQQGILLFHLAVRDLVLRQPCRATNLKFKAVPRQHVNLEGCREVS
eukprot:2971090-Amphidinium_carterae.2